MQINNLQASPNFGMAFSVKGLAKATDSKTADTIKEAVVKYAIPNKTSLRGYKQMLAEQKKLKFYDVVLDAKSKIVSIIDKKTKQVVETYENVVTKEYSKTLFRRNVHTDSFGKLIQNKLEKWLNPKVFLPTNIYRATERAKFLDRIASEEQAFVKKAMKAVK